jgi:hypothetical protein
MQKYLSLYLRQGAGLRGGGSTTNGHEATRMIGRGSLISLVFIRVHSWLNELFSASFVAHHFPARLHDGADGLRRALS